MTKLCEISRAEIEITDAVLGKGAFGEVRAALWRGMNVAYKIVHNSHDSDQELQQSVQRETEILSELRHPNLVLFLGVCTEEKDSITTRAIVTEQLSCSLYDLLEVRKVQLMLPDLLDIALDIAHGLNYLHSRDPAVVHRDISSKNILLNGNRAKITDLGQAKTLSQSILSRQTGMPGAMAYSAPEVLTGKYSVKIDIFSFGILLAQLATGEYPRVDRREDQFQRALAKYPCLDPLLTETTQYNPEQRPCSHDVVHRLRYIRDNDRYYPNQRRNSPEKDIGIEALAWMRETMAGQVADLTRKLDLAQKHLKAEEDRLRSESFRSQSLQTQLEEERAQHQRTKELHQQADQENHGLREQLAQTTRLADNLKDQLKLVAIDLQHWQNKVHSLEGKLASKEMESQALAEDLLSSRQEVSHLSQLLQGNEEQAEQLHRRGQVLSRQLHVQVEYCKDLETRLEQALHRWKQEKDEFTQQQSRLSQLTRQCASLVQKTEDNKADRDRLAKRLQQYEGLPLPDEIKARLEDLTADNQRLSSFITQLQVQQEREEEERIALQTAWEESRRWGEEQASSVNTLQQKMATLEEELASLKEETGQKSTAIQKGEKILAETQKDVERLQLEVQQARETIDRLNVDLAEARRQGSSQAVGTHEQESSRRGDDFSAEGAPRSSGESGEGRGGQAGSGGGTVVIIPLTEETSSTQTPSTDRLSDVAVKHQVERAMGKEGATGLLELIATFPQDERVIWRCLRSLRELVLHDDQCRQQCLAAAPESWLMNAMTRYLAVGMVQAQAARLLGTLAFGNDVFRRRAGEQRAMQCLAAALHVHLSDEVLVLHVFTAVTNLAHGSYENRCRFMECNGIQTLVQAMQMYLASAKLQCQGCWAMLTLAGSDEVAEGIMQAQGDRAVVQALLQHSANEGVQQYGCWALRNLAMASEALAKSLKAQGAMEICRMALEKHAQNPDVAQHAKSTLSTFLSMSAPAPLPQTGTPATLPKIRGTSNRK